jgi:AraC-like DNA-binding protein
MYRGEKARGRGPMDEIEHIEAIERVTLGEPSADAISSSWIRSANRFGVDPSSWRAPTVLTSTEVRERREPLDRLVHTASEELNNLHGIVREAGYVVLLCDSRGVAIDHRGDEKLKDEFKHWGIWLGGDWAEDIEGTNGIGTCIEQQRPVTVHLDQHFRARHIALSCSGAPIFDPEGGLLAVIDVSAMNPALSERAHMLTGPLTVSTARAIEERLFRDTFRRDWIAAVRGNAGEAMLLAVDRDFRIVGADRSARHAFALAPHRLKAGVSFWSCFGRDLSAFRTRDAGDFAVKLSSPDRSQAWQALVTPPHDYAAAGLPLAMHTRPRESLLSSLPEEQPHARTSGGLSTRTIGRVRDFIDTHLAETIEVARLAEIAGLSTFHFSRQFKQTMGVTPHSYLVQRRIDRARRLLESTPLALSEIAVVTGFADQGHMTRHFRRLVGTTPREYRLSHAS